MLTSMRSYSDKISVKYLRILARTQTRIELIGMLSVLFVNGDKSG